MSRDCGRVEYVCRCCGEKTHKLTRINDMMVCNHCLGLLHRENREKKIIVPKSHRGGK